MAQWRKHREWSGVMINTHCWGFFYCVVLSISFVQCLYFFFTFCVCRRVSLTPVSLRSPAVSSLFNTPSSTEKAKHGQWEQLQDATNIHYWGLCTYEGKWKINGKCVPSPSMEASILQSFIFDFIKGALAKASRWWSQVRYRFRVCLVYCVIKSHTSRLLCGFFCLLVCSVLQDLPKKILHFTGFSVFVWFDLDHFDSLDVRKNM